MAPPHIQGRFAGVTACTLVTPVWRADLTPEEVDRLALTTAAVGTTVQRATQRLVLAHPNDLDTSRISRRFPEWEPRAFDPEHFASVPAYSRWLLSPDFYAAFDTDFVGICQLDAVLLAPLPDWVWEVDYTGAPWDPPWRLIVANGRMRLIRVAGRQIGRKITVGNGGLSFRRRPTFERASHRLPGIAPPLVLEESNEDAVWSYYAKELGLRLATADQAASAFLDLREDRDLDPQRLVGIHGVKDDMTRANAAIRREAERRGVSRA